MCAKELDEGGVDDFGVLQERHMTGIVDGEELRARDRGADFSIRLERDVAIVFAPD